MKKALWFYFPSKWVMILVFSCFCTAMAAVCVMAYIKKSGNTGIDSVEMQKTRNRK